MQFETLESYGECIVPSDEERNLILQYRANYLPNPIGVQYLRFFAAAFDRIAENADKRLSLMQSRGDLGADTTAVFELRREIAISEAAVQDIGGYMGVDDSQLASVTSLLYYKKPNKR